MKYKEYMPTTMLMNYIQCIWVLDYNVDYSTKVRFIPDGYFDLLFVFKDREFDKIRLIGICDYSNIVEYNTRETIIGIRMHLMAIKTILTVPINELINTSVLLTPKDLNLNVDTINTTFGNGTFIDYIQSYFIEKYKPGKNENLFYTISKAINSVNIVALKTGYSERQLHRIFTREIGISPKSYLEIVRLRNYLSQNYDAYYDESHKIRNFIKYIGTSPSHLIQPDVRFVQYNSYFSRYAKR